MAPKPFESQKLSGDRLWGSKTLSGRFESLVSPLQSSIVLSTRMPSSVARQKGAERPRRRTKGIRVGQPTRSLILEPNKQDIVLRQRGPGAVAPCRGLGAEPSRGLFRGQKGRLGSKRGQQNAKGDSKGTVNSVLLSPVKH